MAEPTHPDKVLFPEDSLTKADVIAYFDDLCDLMLPHLKSRFLTLHRFPDGIGQEGFYQQRRSEHFPSAVRGMEAPRASGEEAINHILVDDREGLLYLADQATLALHGWQSRCDRPNHPDRLVFDLDPADKDFDAVIEAARLLREALELIGLRPFVMTTGSRGLHVVAPLKRKLEFDEARELAATVADALVARQPNRFTREQRKKARRGRLYLDIGRNAYGQTAIMPYSLRALPGAPVATPLDWGELGKKGMGPRRFRMDNLRRRLAQKSDPWRAFFAAAASPRADDGALARWAGH